MKIYVVIDDEPYERTTLIAAYADRTMAERRVQQMIKQRERWLNKQKQLEDAGSDDAYLTNPPHNYQALFVTSLTVIPNEKVEAPK